MIKEKLMIFDNQTLFGFANTIGEVHEKLNKFYYNTLWQQYPSKIEVYEVVTESNGYQHEGKKVYIASSKEYWGGKYGKWGKN